jgi:hypothetical protein
MSLPFIFLLNMIVLARLSFTTSDQPLAVKRIAIVSAIQVIGLLVFQPNLAWWLLIGVLLLINTLHYWLEKTSGRIYRTRIQSLLADVLVLSVFTAPWGDLRFNAWLVAWLNSMQQYSLLLHWMADTDWLRFHTITFGVLFVTNEANILTRYLIQVWRLSPGKDGKGEKKTLETGRIIGILERVLIYYLILNAQFAAIGLILAAKGFTRYKELEKRKFAEYMLIGTLLSTLLAAVTAGLVQMLLG